jgi:PIN domain nuclease of toxin-antitoxin system
MRGLLLDTHPLVWIAANLAISRSAELAIGKAQSRRELFVSPITAWEVGVSSMKKSAARRPPLNDLPPDLWFRTNLRKFRAQLAPFNAEIASESARVPALYGSGDPGDCILIATAHVLNLPLVTRDRRIINFAKKQPDYLSVIAC